MVDEESVVKANEISTATVEHIAQRLCSSHQLQALHATTPSYLQLSIVDVDEGNVDRFHEALVSHGAVTEGLRVRLRISQGAHTHVVCYDLGTAGSAADPQPLFELGSSHRQGPLAAVRVDIGGFPPCYVNVRSKIEPDMELVGSKALREFARKCLSAVLERTDNLDKNSFFLRRDKISENSTPNDDEGLASGAPSYCLLGVDVRESYRSVRVDATHIQQVQLGRKIVFSPKNEYWKNDGRVAWVMWQRVADRISFFATTSVTCERWSVTTALGSLLLSPQRVLRGESTPGTPTTKSVLVAKVGGKWGIDVAADGATIVGLSNQRNQLLACGDRIISVDGVDVAADPATTAAALLDNNTTDFATVEIQLSVNRQGYHMWRSDPTVPWGLQLHDNKIVHIEPWSPAAIAGIPLGYSVRAATLDGFVGKVQLGDAAAIPIRPPLEMVTVPWGRLPRSVENVAFPTHSETGVTNVDEAAAKVGLRAPAVVQDADEVGQRFANLQISEVPRLRDYSNVDDVHSLPPNPTTSTLVNEALAVTPSGPPLGTAWDVYNMTSLESYATGVELLQCPVDKMAMHTAGTQDTPVRPPGTLFTTDQSLLGPLSYTHRRVYQVSDGSRSAAGVALHLPSDIQCDGGDVVPKGTCVVAWPWRASFDPSIVRITGYKVQRGKTEGTQAQPHGQVGVRRALWCPKYGLMLAIPFRPLYCMPVSFGCSLLDATAVNIFSPQLPLTNVRVPNGFPILGFHRTAGWIVRSVVNRSHRTLIPLQPALAAPGVVTKLYDV